MASIKRTKNIVQINNSNQKLNSFNKNSPNQSENTNSKEDNNSNYIEKSFLAELLKCEICNNLFDLNTHIPMVMKCGHTFCKKCILEKNLFSKQPNKYEACPLDNMQNIFNIESCIINLRIELLIKKIFFYSSSTINSQPSPQKINQKQRVYTKPDMKKTRTVTNNNNQNNRLNPHSPINNQKGEYGYKKLDTNSNHNKKSDKKNNEINEGLTSPQIEDEMNINNENKFFFEDEKINGVMINETIDTIPIYDEKSFCNVSFKEDVNELLAKNISNKKPLLNDNIKKELNKNKYITQYNTKKKNKKKNLEMNDNNQKVQLTKPITNFSLTPNKNKDNQILTNYVKEENNNNTDRDYINIGKIENKYNLNLNDKNIILENKNNRDSIEKETDDMAKYKNYTHQAIAAIEKMQLNLDNPTNNDFTEEKNINENIRKNNDDDLMINNIKSSRNNNIIVINKSKNKDNSKNKKDLFINTQYYPSKKIILFSSTTTNNNNRLCTNPNNENNEKLLKKSVILNKNANILSTQILKKNNNTIEAKNEINYEELIKSSNKKTTRNYYNNSDNENEIQLKNRTYNSKKNDSIHDSIMENLMNNSNKDYKNKKNDLVHLQIQILTVPKIKKK